MEKKKTKKWLIIFSVLILIAIIVTLVIVFWPKDPNRIKGETIEQSQSMFLGDTKEKELYEELREKVAQNNLGDDKTAIVDRFELMSNQLGVVMNFYASNIVFVENNKTLQNEFGKIIRSYDKADSSKENLLGLLDEVKKLGGKDSNFIEGALEQIQEEYKVYYKNNVDAIVALSDVFKNCYKQGVYANEMTYLVIDIVNSYLKAINLRLSTDANATLSAKVNAFNKFLTYLTDQTEIKSFVFDKALQEKIEKVETFEKVFGKTYADLIATIDDEGLSFSSNVVDTNGVLDSVKEFLRLNSEGGAV